MRPSSDNPRAPLRGSAPADGAVADPRRGREISVLTLVPKHWFSWDYRVVDAGVDVALIDRDLFAESASFSVDGKEYVARRTSIVHGTFVLEHSGRVLAHATKPSAFERLFELAVGREHYIIRAASWLTSEFQVMRGSSEIGAIRRDSIFSWRGTAELPADMPREAQIFAIFLVLVLWKRSAGAG